MGRGKRILVLFALAAVMSTAAAPFLPAGRVLADREVETVWLGKPKHVYWETDTVAKWTSVSRAHEYQVKLYKADDVDRDEENWRYVDFDDDDMYGAECVVMKRVSDTSYDFSLYMKDLHSYFFVVRATPKTSELAYVEEGDWVASPDNDFRQKTVMGVTEGMWRNFLEGSVYDLGDGTFLTQGWQLIRGKWYLLDENGYRLSGWQTVDGKTYYLSESGGWRPEGWFLYGDEWYYAGEDGSIQTGWIMTVPGCYYYLNADGTMAHDTVVDGYELGSDGLRGDFVA